MVSSPPLNVSFISRHIILLFCYGLSLTGNSLSLLSVIFIHSFLGSVCFSFLLFFLSSLISLFHLFISFVSFISYSNLYLLQYLIIILTSRLFACHVILLIYASNKNSKLYSVLTRLFQENWTAGIDRHATANNAHADLSLKGGRVGE
jgi:hypothetical protein